MNRAIKRAQVAQKRKASKTHDALARRIGGGLDTPENCAASCFECNQARDQTDHGAFMRFRQAQREAADG